MTKFVFVTGGVVSSLGKGIAAASLAAILESRGLKVTMAKYNQLLRIEEDLGDIASYPGRDAFYNLK